MTDPTESSLLEEAMTSTPDASAQNPPTTTPPPGTTQTQTQTQTETPPTTEPTKEGEPPKTETPPADTKPPEAPKAPEKYEDFKIPEGVTLDKAGVEQFKEVAKGLNLTQEQAQKLIDMQTGLAQTQQTAALEQYKQQVNAWRDETVKELGPNYKAELSVAAKSIERFGTPELRKLMNDTGLGNQKEFVKFLVKVGKSISEDKFTEGTRQSGPTNPADILYPKRK